jgi:hypothetical protein
MVDLAKLQTQYKLEHEPKVEVKNFPNTATPEDINNIVTTLEDVLDGVMLSDQATAVEISDRLEELIDAVKSIPQVDLKPLSEKIEKQAKSTTTVKVVNPIDNKDVVKAIKDLKLDPKIDVAAPSVEVQAPTLDLTPVAKAVSELKLQLTKLVNKEQPKLDIKPFVKAAQATTDAINSLSFPVPNYVIPYKDTDGKGTQVQLDSNGAVPISGSLTSSPARATDSYGIQAVSNDGTYKYFFFEDDSANYYIMRKTLATNIFKYTKGTGGYASVYQSEILGPSGSPTWADRGTTF